MRKNSLFILLLIMLLMLAGCVAPHANAMGEPSSDIVILESGHAAEHAQVVVTLRPVPTPTASPEPTPAPTPESSPSMPEPSQILPGPVNPSGTEGERVEGQKYAYLTFDDGPSKNTDAILEVLSEKGVTATFFVIGDNAGRYPDKVRAIASQGSIVANHTQTHKTDVIYQSGEAFLKDLDDGRQTILSILGDDYVDDLIRFPYGSTNRRCRDYRDLVKDAGYRYFDWNALNGDAESGSSKRSAEELYKELVDTVDTQAARGRDLIILMHDTNSKGATVEMLPDAIDYISSLGYTFDTLENKSME